MPLPLPMHRFRAAIIDLDGTLLHTVLDLAAACNGMLHDMDSTYLGPRKLSTEAIEKFVGKGAERLVHRCLTGDLSADAPVRHFAQGLQLFNRHYAVENGLHSQIYPGVIEGLEAMRAHGIQLACVTNKPQQFALDLLRKKQLDHYFEFIQGGDVLHLKKPDALPLVWAASRLGLAPSDCVAIGDSINDCLAAQAAGMAMLAVPYGYNEGEPVSNLPCNAVVDSLMAAWQAHII